MSALPKVRETYHPFPLADDGTDLGMRVPAFWNVSGELADAVKRGALALREKHEYAPPSRERIVFRASELGNILSVRDAKGRASGCARKTWLRFHADRYAPAKLSAEAVLNFAKGNFAEGTMETYLREAGLFVEGQVKLGAWAACEAPESCPGGAEPSCGVPAYLHEDARFPDRSGGLARGKADFIIRVEGLGEIPLEFKSISSFAYPWLKKDGPKPEHVLQGGFYGHEMDTTHFAVGYVDKESGDVTIFLCRTSAQRFWDRVFERLMWMRDSILDGELPPAPMGTHAPQADPDRVMRNGFHTYRVPEAYYDRVWPCYVWGSKKKRVTACEYFAHCHGRLPAQPAHKPERIKRAPKAKAALATKKAVRFRVVSD